jgi:hypothetical protein
MMVKGEMKGFVASVKRAKEVKEMGLGLGFLKVERETFIFYDERKIKWLLAWGWKGCCARGCGVVYRVVRKRDGQLGVFCFGLRKSESS